MLFSGNILLNKFKTILILNLTKKFAWPWIHDVSFKSFVTFTIVTWLHILTDLGYCLSKENKFVAILTAWCKLSDKTLTSDIFNAFFLEIITIFLKKKCTYPCWTREWKHGFKEYTSIHWPVQVNICKSLLVWFLI